MVVHEEPKHRGDTEGVLPFLPNTQNEASLTRDEACDVVEAQQPPFVLRSSLYWQHFSVAIVADRVVLDDP